MRDSSFITEAKEKKKREQSSATPASPPKKKKHFSVLWLYLQLLPPPPFSSETQIELRQLHPSRSLAHFLLLFRVTCRRDKTHPNQKREKWSGDAVDEINFSFFRFRWCVKSKKHRGTEGGRRDAAPLNDFWRAPHSRNSLQKKKAQSKARFLYAQQSSDRGMKEEREQQKKGERETPNTSSDIEMERDIWKQVNCHF